MLATQEHKQLHAKWHSMKSRCNTAHYRKRGITICSQWIDSYATFRIWALANGFKPELQLDRIDNDGNYTPENCRWVSHTVNNCNRNKFANNTTGFVGVSWCRDRYTANVYLEGKSKFLGLFDTAIEAATARDTYIVDNNLPHKLNLADKLETANASN